MRPDPHRPHVPRWKLVLAWTVFRTLYALLGAFLLGQGPRQLGFWPL